ncbi:MULTISPECIES: HAD family hydrolase [unclassified Gordonia (in: high G+C Gram-positive bacteria)]|uniref:HAD family hydrolase n=1 Tax=unclassified Gordonia (in: high G+C Gram-positive bacteria) TaxID=2657482 RepID=UPI001FFED614|nr:MULTISPECIES: HAD-IB family hydrolase [unclassified Gordonia (in: high G+C Gram-positive bacteria)]UQE74609.1 HAD-IB family hydrolase [Gordonia sp. PP30]
MSRNAPEPDDEFTPSPESTDPEPGASVDDDAELAASVREAQELAVEQFGEHVTDAEIDAAEAELGEELSEAAEAALREEEESRRVAAWLSDRAGRFRQSAAELRQVLAGEASATAAIESLRARIPDEAATADGQITDLTAAAFFDVDNTLVHGASIVLFARGLAAHKYFSYSDIMSAVWQQAKFRLTGRENMDDVAQGRDKALSFIAGRPTEELVQLGEEIYDDYIADKIWPGTQALAQRHLAAGQQVWLVTATPVELAQVIAKRLGLTGALGTVAESEDGIFTGRLVGDILHGPGKAHAIRSLAVREGLNLKRCTAYSDSYNDVPMLSLVGTAVAINPDADLRDVAKVRGWESYDFRTARKAAKYGLGSAMVLGAATGGAFIVGHLLRERLAHR